MTVFNTLDLSGCSIGDAGIEALAIALKKHPLCVRHIDLSNNHITDEGAMALARALLENGQVETLDLSNNKDIGDRGAKELARAVQEGCIQNMILRSCHLHADGIACFGQALKNLATKQKSLETEDASIKHLSIDLSGNPLGILRKKPKSGNKYSASALKSKATETTAAYMNMIGKTFQKGLKDLGLAENDNGFDTLESDDEESDEESKAKDDDSKNKCGALAFAESFIDDGEEEGEEDTQSTKSITKDKKNPLQISLGLRHCTLDTRAAEALAAVLQESRHKYPDVKLTMDLRMNDVLEEDTIAALRGDDGYESQIDDMAEQYLDAMEVIKQAQERAKEAARIARERARVAAEYEAAWDAPVAMRARDDDGDDRWDYEEEAWDSDADYDVPGEDDEW